MWIRFMWMLLCWKSASSFSFVTQSFLFSFLNLKFNNFMKKYLIAMNKVSLVDNVIIQYMKRSWFFYSRTFSSITYYIFLFCFIVLFSSLGISIICTMNHLPCPKCLSLCLSHIYVYMVSLGSILLSVSVI